jgi:hypothetical protein
MLITHSSTGEFSLCSHWEPEPRVDVLIGIVAPHTNWTSTVAWAQAVGRSGVDAIWSADERDPVVFLSALSQLVPGLRLGLFVSAVSDRPALLAARQLITLDHLCDGRLEIVVDDVTTYDEIFSVIRDQLPVTARLRTASVWCMNEMGVGNPAVFRESVTPRELEDLERREISCVITRSLAP